jgi:cytochrome c oxidase subunit 3
MGVLAFVAFRVARAQLSATTAHPLELAAVYWHLVDVVWIFLWPLFYLIPSK